MDPTPDFEPFLIHGPAGRIEGRIESPSANSRPRGLAVFAHPHPRFGGTMQNSVVVRGARVLASLGLTVARFNFRGVGRSEGKHDEGRGELDDLLAVIDWLRARGPQGSRVVAAGFSFGSIRAYEACARGAADCWLGVAPPLKLPQPRPLPRLTRPAALVLAGADELALPSSTAELAERFADLRAVEVVAGAGHMFMGRISELSTAIASAAAPLLAASPGSSASPS